MKRFAVVFLVLLAAAVFLASTDVSKIPPMPVPVTDNAVASLRGGLDLYSLMGIGAKKTWDGVTNRVFVLHVAAAKWSEERPVPGVAGRLGSSAIAAKNRVYLFGGYVLDADGHETTVGNVDAYVPEKRSWARGDDIPVPVDSAVIGVVRDRYVYLIGGRAKTGPVNNVQVYDAEQNKWSQATPFPGTPVFGHAGGIAEETIVIIDGARKNPQAGPAYIASDECWVGKIDHKDPLKISWTQIIGHPGTARFGIIAGAGEKDRRIFFSGGTTEPHNYKGLDGFGKPAVVSSVTFAFDTHGDKWETLAEDLPDARADSHGVLATPVGHIILGGTLASQEIGDRLLVLPKRAE